MTETPKHALPDSRPRRLAFADLKFRADRARNGDKEADWMPYISFSTAAAILDDWVGPANWRNDYELVKVGGVECMAATISLTFDDGVTWVPKTNIGTPTSFEKEKGLFSDAFKRAAVMWGVGRELNSFGSITAPAKVDRKSTGGNGKDKVTCYKTAATDKVIKEKLRAMRAQLDGDVDSISVDDLPEDNEPEATTAPVEAPPERLSKHAAEIEAMFAQIRALPDETRAKIKAECATAGIVLTRKLAEWKHPEVSALEAIIHAVQGEEPFEVTPPPVQPTEPVVSAPPPLDADQGAPADSDPMSLVSRLKEAISNSQFNKDQVLGGVNALRRQGGRAEFATLTVMCDQEPDLAEDVCGIVTTGELPDDDLVLNRPVAA